MIRWICRLLITAFFKAKPNSLRKMFVWRFVTNKKEKKRILAK